MNGHHRDLHGLTHSVPPRPSSYLRSTARVVDSKEIRVEARSDRPERLSLIVPGEERPVAPTNWSFGQLCSLVSAPASYLRELPAAQIGCGRSEEHTSELQSLMRNSYAVFCLKKKKQNKTIN